MKQLEVHIMGQSYMLGCPEGGEARLRDAVERVDAAMCRIRDAGKVKARDRIAVLAALNLAFESPDAPHAARPDAPPASRSAAQAVDEQAAASQAAGAQEARLLLLAQRIDQTLSSDGRLF
jgi:cell division protein ZapA